MHRNDLHVLLVDDEPDMLGLLEVMMKQAFDFTIEKAEDCLTARRMLSSSSFDLVLLDYELPDGTGFDILRGLKTRKDSPAVLMVTGRGDETIAVNAFNLGVSGYIIKDTRLRETLIRTVSDLIPVISRRKEPEVHRWSGLDILGYVPWGTHLCLFYETTDDLIDIITPFFKAGLEMNDSCMWIISEPLSVNAGIEKMSHLIPEFDSFLEKGQMEVLPYTEWYLKEDHFNIRGVLDDWVKKLERAREIGYEGLRASGMTTWVDGYLWDEFLEYERQVDIAALSLRALAICPYCIQRCESPEVIDVFSTHDTAIIRKDSQWVSIGNVGRARAIKSLKESESRYRALVDNFRESTWAIDIDANTTYVNPGMAEMLGYTVEEMEGRSLFDFVSKGERGLVEELIHRHGEGVSERLEIKLEKRGAGQICARMEGSCIHDKEGNLMGLAFTVTDVTDHMDQEK